MRKRKQTRAEQREYAIRARKPVLEAIVALEKKWGVSVVSSAFARHTQIRRERQRLHRLRQEINDKIAKLR